MNYYEQKIADKRERYADLATRKRAEATRLYETGTKALEMIPLGQPILVGHHSERADRAYRGRAVGKIDKSFEIGSTADYYADKAENYGKNSISSDDPEAVTKLKEKLIKLQGKQETMKRMNVERRKSGEEKVPGWMLSNNNANMRTIKKRIAQLEKNETAPEAKPVIGNGWIVKEDKEENRIIFTFDAIPNEDTRTLLKRNGFKWSPTRSAWVRMLNNQARRATAYILRTLTA